MAEREDLLVEIGTEELPPKALRRLSLAFGEGIRAGLDAAGLEHAETVTYATPRRLAVHVTEVQTSQEEREIERRGPALAQAFDEGGKPTRAAEGFANSCGVAVEHLEHLETDKGTWLAFRTTEMGQLTSSLLPGIVESALAGLPIPRRMRWGASDIEFVRPVHWVLLLLGEDYIEAEVMGVACGRETRGHRFHCPELLSVACPGDYATLLYSQGFVVVDFDSRREMIKRQVADAAAELGGEAELDEGLLDEVTSLVEWPVPIVGGFEEEFLKVPGPALVASMKSHQKYFPVRSKAGDLLPNFIAISNIDSTNPDAVRSGNERVIRPRLADAAFFYAQDLKATLESRLESLKPIVFQDQLGSVHDKAERVSSLAGHVAIATGLSPEQVKQARRAGMLSKCDLVTEMVGEFPDLQGHMGCAYARNDGEDEAVAIALDEAYMPRFAGDRIAASAVGQAVAIADRLDTVLGIFGIGKSPTGEKDPYGLRRAALGALRTLIEGDLDAGLSKLLAAGVAGYGDRLQSDGLAEQVEGFMMERLRGYFADQGVGSDVFAAVLAIKPSRPRDFARRVTAVAEFRKLPEAESLAAANKRIQNILRKAETEPPTEVNDELFATDAEWNLAAKLVGLSPRVNELLGKGDYTAAMTHLAGLRDSVDAFFDGVMVMDDNPAVRGNRLALLNNIRQLFLQTADISQLQA